MKLSEIRQNYCFGHVFVIFNELSLDTETSYFDSVLNTLERCVVESTKIGIKIKF